MDYYVNSKTEEETIYEIYKSCRLCGAGAGYKMPIIQNVINLDPDETELKQKIRECVQIEVHQDDKMPPLVCELCVDKVNDFYEFLEMCKQTNKKTRLRLGLPPQTLPRGAPDAGDCILGVTEPVFINDNNSNEPILSRSSRTNKAVKIKKEPEPKVNTKFRKKDEHITPKSAEAKKDDSKTTRLSESRRDSKVPKVELNSHRSGRNRQPSPPPSPPRSLRGKKRPSEDNVPLNKTQITRKVETPPMKSILKKVRVDITDDLLEPRSKRPRDCTRVSIDTPKGDHNKKLKLTLTIPKLKVEPRPTPPSPPVPNKCPKCKNVFKTAQGLTAHMNTHVKVEKVEKPKPAPKPVLKPESKPVSKPEPRTNQKCTWCDRSFPAILFKEHKCASKRPTVCRYCKRKFRNAGHCTNHEKTCRTVQEGNTAHRSSNTPHQRAECRYCERKFQTAGACTNHEKVCRTLQPASTAHHSSNTQRKLKMKIPQWLKSQLLPMEVRLMRCDPLLDDNGRCRDACFVDHDYGLDKRREYPYLYNLSMLKHKLRIKSELAMYDRMVKIQDEIRDEFGLDECYTHWDSASESDSDKDMCVSKSKTGVKPLSTLSLKVLFSPKGLGKVPKKLRKIKSEKPFDSILNSTELDSDIKFGINNIINSLEDSVSENDKTKDFINVKYKTRDEDALFGENKGPGVKNSDFDSLFNNASSSDFNKSTSSSHEGVERGESPTLDLKDVDNRLSQTDKNTKFNIGDGNSSSVSNTENSHTSIENDSHNKSESENIDRIDSSQASEVISNSGMVLDKEVEKIMIPEKKAVESKEGSENINSKSAVSTMVENSTGDKKDDESITGKKIEDNNRQNEGNDTARNLNHESRNTDYSKNSYCKSTNNTVPKEKPTQENVEQNKSSTNGDSEFPEKFMDDLEAVSDTDMDDGKLMEAIDAQLGESECEKSLAKDNLSSKLSRESDDFTKDIEF